MGYEHLISMLGFLSMHVYVGDMCACDMLIITQEAATNPAVSAQAWLYLYVPYVWRSMFT